MLAFTLVVISSIPGAESGIDYNHRGHSDQMEFAGLISVLSVISVVIFAG